jgi:lysozyme
VVAVVGAVVVRRQVWQPHYRPSLDDGQSYGVDVSHYQGEIDWSAVAGDGISFAYIKATEGGDWVDEYFALNWSSAREHGLAVGAYHFFTLCRTGRDQATNVLRVVPTDEADLPLAVDLEFPNNCADRPPVDELHRELDEFLDTLETATGRPVLVYVQDEFDERYDILGSFAGPRWERSILDRPDGVEWLVWQFIDFARVDGISGGVDLNVMSDVLETLEVRPDGDG